MENEEMNRLRINVIINFEKNPSLQEFQDMLNALNEIHKYAVINSQPEYNKLNIRYGFGQLLPHHELLVSNVSRRNPFDFEFIITLSQHGITEFWSHLKLFFALCTKYNSISNVKLFTNQLSSWLIKKSSEIGEKKEEKSVQIGKRLLRKIGYIISEEKLSSYFDVICNGTAIIEELYCEVTETGIREYFIKDKKFAGFD